MNEKRSSGWQDDSDATMMAQELASRRNVQENGQENHCKSKITGLLFDGSTEKRLTQEQTQKRQCC